MTGRIVTVRHGRPDMDRTIKITAKEYGVWWSQYDEAGLAPGQGPSEALLTVAAECDTIICSTLPRAIETASCLVDGAQIVPRDEMFVEAPLPAPPIPWLKLTPTGWGRVSRIMWFLGYAPNGIENHFAARRRVKNIVSRLIEHTQRGESVLLAAHGYLNWMIDGEITKMGCNRVQHVGGNDFWSFRDYRTEAQTARKTQEDVTAK